MTKYMVLTLMCSCPIFISLSVPLLNAQLSEVNLTQAPRELPTAEMIKKPKVMKSKKIISYMLICILTILDSFRICFGDIYMCVHVCINVWISFCQNIIQPRRNKIFKYQPPWALPEENKLIAKPSHLLSSQLLTSSNSSFFTPESLISSPISIQGPKSLLLCPCLSSLTTHCLQLGEPI